MKTNYPWKESVRGTVSSDVVWHNHWAGASTGRSREFPCLLCHALAPFPLSSVWLCHFTAQSAGCPGREISQYSVLFCREICSEFLPVLCASKWWKFTAAGIAYKSQNLYEIVHFVRPLTKSPSKTKTKTGEWVLMCPSPSPDLQQKPLKTQSLKFEDRKNMNNVQQMWCAKDNCGKKHYLNS